jgi:Leucine Rich repeat
MERSLDRPAKWHRTVFSLEPAFFVDFSYMHATSFITVFTLVQTVLGARVADISIENMNEILGYFDTFQDIVAFNLSSHNAYGILKPIFDFRRFCQTTSKGTWPDLHVDAGKVLDSPQCLAHVNKYLYIYTNVRLSGPVEAVTSFMQAIGPSQAVNFELSFPRNMQASTLTHISSHSLEALLEASRPKRISLEWFGRNLKDGISTVIAHYIQNSNIVSLNFGGVGITSELASEICDSLPGSRVTHLSLTRVMFRTGVQEVVRHCVKELHRTSFEYLDLSSNSMNELDAVALFAALPNIPSLKTLKVAFNSITETDLTAAQSLAAILPLTNIKELDIACSIGAEGFKVLVKVLPQCHSLTILRLAANLFGDEGVNNLALVLPHTDLTDVDLSLTGVTDIGIISLAASVGRSKIRSLDVSSNHISMEAVNVLRDAMPRNSKLITNVTDQLFGNV